MRNHTTLLSGVHDTFVTDNDMPTMVARVVFDAGCTPLEVINHSISRHIEDVIGLRFHRIFLQCCIIRLHPAVLMGITTIHCMVVTLAKKRKICLKTFSQPF